MSDDEVLVFKKKRNDKEKETEDKPAKKKEETESSSSEDEKPKKKEKTESSSSEDEKPKKPAKKKEKTDSSSEEDEKPKKPAKKNEKTESSSSEDEKPKKGKKPAKKKKDTTEESDWPSSSSEDEKPKRGKKPAKKKEETESSSLEDEKPIKRKQVKKKSTKPAKKKKDTTEESDWPSTSSEEEKPKRGKKPVKKKEETESTSSEDEKPKRGKKPAKKKEETESSSSEEEKPKRGKKPAKKKEETESTSSEEEKPKRGKKPTKKKEETDSSSSQDAKRKKKKQTTSDDDWPSENDSKSNNGDCIERSKLPLKEHQKLLVNHFRNQRGILVNHSLGSGKTLSAVSASQCFLDDNPTGRVIVVTPTSLQANFKKEMKQYDPKMSFAKYDFYTIDGFSRAFSGGKLNCKNHMLIVDEVHNLRTATSTNKKSGAPTKGKRVHALLECAKKASKVMLLTATPIVNEPYDLANLLAMIDGDKPMHKKDFAIKLNNEEEFNDLFRCKISIYNPPDDEVKKFYPKFEIHTEFIPMPPDYEKKYIEVENEQNNRYANPNMFYNGVRRASNFLDDQMDSPKIVWLRYFLQDNEKGKIVIFSHWLEAGIKTVKKVLDEFDISYAHIDGGVKADERSEAVREYNNNEIRVLLLTKAGGEGLDLKGTRYMILLDPGWNPGTAEQVIGRGIRFKSHYHLPKDEQIVDVYRLYLVKKNDAELEKKKEERKKKKVDTDDTYVKNEPSVDKYLYNLAKAKENMIKTMIARLKPLSIEENKCS